MKENTKEIVDVNSLNLKKGDLVKEVEELCGENLYGCYQCGTCSAGCPFVDDMDLSPDEILRYVILDRKEVLNSKTIWLCAACYTCAERCPRDINITKIMEALRQIILRKKIDKTNIRKIAKEEMETIPQLAFVCLFRKNVG
ncbi:MAG: 4Fe-4S dicluster domain-containing protein [Candidatus Thermoplasmatota archaeon]|nr:4Fe-4S dicluster domain-containing protein [Candidatus Thermoplasmatota archaeon]MBU1941699.1 4Fe-4S dicluster domain-containing protein [Candidatus Thermoplasmatota archaeon]